MRTFNMKTLNRHRRREPVFVKVRLRGCKILQRARDSLERSGYQRRKETGHTRLEHGPYRVSDRFLASRWVVVVDAGEPVHLEVNESGGDVLVGGGRCDQFINQVDR